jgi:hypothetical protein
MKNALQYPETQTLLSVPSATSLPFVAFLTAVLTAVLSAEALA